MATSVMMSSTDNNGGYLTQPLPKNHDQPIRRSSGGRRKVKNGGEQKKKKEAQRGMGVEKLERLRIAEILKNPAANNSSLISESNLLNGFGPFQHSMLGGFGAPNGQMGLNQLSFHGGVVVSDDPFNTVLSGSKIVKEISKDLSSNPNAALKCQFEYCTPDSCKKKKRFNGGNLGFGARVMNQDMNNNNIQMCSAGGGDCGFLGLSVGDNIQNVLFNQEINQSHGFKTHLVDHVGCPGQPGVEVLAVHKKGPSSSSSSLSNQENESLVMEYEFFPGCRTRDSKNDELVMMEQNMVGLISEADASWGDDQTFLGIGAPGPGFDAASTTSSIDLSLKLSY